MSTVFAQKLDITTRINFTMNFDNFNDYPSGDGFLYQGSFNSQKLNIPSRVNYGLGCTFRLNRYVHSLNFHIEKFDHFEETSKFFGSYLSFGSSAVRQKLHEWSYQFGYDLSKSDWELRPFIGPGILYVTKGNRTYNGDFYLGPSFTEEYLTGPRFFIQSGITLKTPTVFRLGCFVQVYNRLAVNKTELTIGKMRVHNLIFEGGIYFRLMDKKNDN